MIEIPTDGGREEKEVPYRGLRLIYNELDLVIHNGYRSAKEAVHYIYPF